MDINLYLSVREKEGRLYSDEIVARLPSVPDGHPLRDEWRARSASALRLTKYLSRDSEPRTILDLGCGNGWLSNLLCQAGHHVIGVDLNEHELKQAARVFASNRGLCFLEADIFAAPFQSESFDVILLSSVIQYFEDLPAVLNTLLRYLKPAGEIHIIDSPLYSDDESTGAVERSRRYYSALGFPQMADHYFHHRKSDLEAFDADWLYRHPSCLKRWWGGIDSPFPWVVVTRKDSENQEKVIAEAFSRTAEKYDVFAEDHPNLTRIRNKVYARLEHWVPAGSRILELNAGTGIDAVELARRRYQVHAMDIAPGMLERVHDKIRQYDLGGIITTQQCSFIELDKVNAAPFDAVFSNLGGLNCIPDLSPVIAQLRLVLRQNGFVIWTLMPPVCLWEMGEIFRARPRLAFRRFSPNGVRSHLEGLHFTVHYFTPKKVLQWFGDDFECLAVEGLSVFTPTAESKNFARQFPRLYRALSLLDDQLESQVPFRGWGDFFTIILRYRPKSK